MSIRKLYLYHVFFYKGQEENICNIRNYSYKGRKLSSDNTKWITGFVFIFYLIYTILNKHLGGGLLWAAIGKTPPSNFFKDDQWVWIFLLVYIKIPYNTGTNPKIICSRKYFGLCFLCC